VLLSFVIDDFFLLSSLLLNKEAFGALGGSKVGGTVTSPSTLSTFDRGVVISRKYSKYFLACIKFGVFNSLAKSPQLCFPLSL
jgi:hypothetical protein